MLEAIRAALKPAGRLVIVEPISDRRRGATRAEQTREHEIAPEFVLQDVRAAGFRIIGLEDPFTNRGNTIDWILIVTPATGTTPAEETSACAALILRKLDFEDSRALLGGFEPWRKEGRSGDRAVTVR
jgi:hypothetical protein